MSIKTIKTDELISENGIWKVREGSKIDTPNIFIIHIPSKSVIEITSKEEFGGYTIDINDNADIEDDDEPDYTNLGD